MIVVDKSIKGFSTHNGKLSVDDKCIGVERFQLCQKVRGLCIYGVRCSMCFLVAISQSFFVISCCPGHDFHLVAHLRTSTQL